MIKRCYVVCEGQSEEKFIKETLAPYFYSSNIYLTPLIVPTSKNHKGGGLSYDRVFNFIIKLIKQDREVFITTLFDYYALDSKFLDNVEHNNDIYQYIKNIQEHFTKEIKGQCNTNKFFSHIQPHEFESLLFSDITKIIKADAEWNKNLINELEIIIKDFDNPELINNSQETSPSHRLKNIFSYPKIIKYCMVAKLLKKLA